MSSVLETIVLKVFQYVLSLKINKMSCQNIDFEQEFGVTFSALQDVNFCSQIEVYHQSTSIINFNVRSFLKDIGGVVNSINDIQFKNNAISFTVRNTDGSKITTIRLGCRDHQHAHSSSRSNSKINQGCLVIHSIEEEITSKEESDTIPHFSITLNVNLTTNTMFYLQNLTLNFMKKCQIMNPYLTITSSMYNHSQRRFVMSGILPEKINYMENVSSYFRYVMKTDLDTPVNTLTRHIHQTSSSSSIRISLIYTCAANANIGKENHFQVFLFSEQGLPLSIEKSKWHAAVLLQDLPHCCITVASEMNCCDITNICYNTMITNAPVCILVMLVVKNVNTLEIILKDHGKEVAAAINKVLEKIVSTIEANEKDRKLRHMAVSSLGSIIRFSENNQFRQECLQLLQASDSMDAEKKLDMKIQIMSKPH